LFTPAVGTVRHMNVEIDSAGDVHAAWMEDGPGATDSIRYLQFNPAGLGTAYGDQYLATSMTSVNVAGLPQNGTPHLWVDTTGRPLVVWAEDKLVNTGLDIYIKRGTNANVPVFPVTAVKVNHDLTAFGRTDPNDRDQLHPSVAVDGSNRIWVVWEDRRQYSNGIDDYGEIYSRVYDDVFTTLIPDVPANHFDVHHWIGDHSPWIAFDRANPGTTNAVMTWTADYTNTTDNVLSSVGTFQ
ncbi:MAG TPA: hypothetical protein VEI97_16160, partial [bacterium]|nr:hypothetical protein [bacterium]